MRVLREMELGWRTTSNAYALNKVLFLMSLIYVSSILATAQNHIDLEKCIVQTSQIEEIEEILYSFSNGGEAKLIIMKHKLANALAENNTKVDIDSMSFSDYRNKIYIESDAFIFSYEIDYWLCFERIVLLEEYAKLEFKTSSWNKIEDYDYIDCTVELHKINGNWMVSKKTIQESDNHLCQ